MRRSVSTSVLVVWLCACGAGPGPWRDATLDSASPDLAAPDRVISDVRALVEVRPDGSLCPSPPCAARPIVFVHGHAGSNDDFLWLLDALAKEDPRWTGYELAGCADHGGWAASSLDRKRWLFAFDYYLKLRTDARGSYTAGPGRIGSNTSHSCASPSGQGRLVADSAEYDQGVGHDYAADLAGFIESVRRATGAESVDVVAHSMGGLVLRSYLAYHGGASRVKRALLLASPVKGIALAALGALVPFIHPAWMNKHEIAEIDAGSFLSAVRFVRCGEPAPRSYGGWAGKLLEDELASKPATELHVMSGAHDLYMSYDATDHPLAVSHGVVDADHPGILKRGETLNRVRDLLGGTL